MLVLELGYIEKNKFPETDMNTTSYSFHMKAHENLKKKKQPKTHKILRITWSTKSMLCDLRLFGLYKSRT